MAPVVLRLKEAAEAFEVKVAVTAQHRQMLDQVLELFGVVPDYDLDLMTPDQDLFDITVRVIKGLKELLAKEMPHLVLVHGDTTTTFAAARRPFTCISRWAMWRQACAPGISPTPFQKKSTAGWLGPWRTITLPLPLGPVTPVRQSVPAEKIWVTGNTVIDALQMIATLVAREDKPCRDFPSERLRSHPR